MLADDSNDRQCRAWSCRFRGWLVLPLLLIALSSCQRSPPEERLRDAVKDLQASIQQRDSASMSDWLAEDFIGPEGLDRDGARRLAQVLYLRHRNIDVAIGPMQVDLRQDHATVAFTAVLTGGAGGFLPDSGRIYDVRTGWRMEGHQWRLTSARWAAVNR